jgi:hypothetical protein
MKMNIQVLPTAAVRVDDDVVYVRMETPGEDEATVRVWWFKTNKGDGDGSEALQLTAMLPEVAQPLEDQFLKGTADEQTHDS